MRLYNTLSGTIENFDAGPSVSLYVCGVTPYDTTHLGHARTYVAFDILVRQLVATGHRVDYVQNITDVDDSILKRAADLRVSYEDLGDRNLGIYFDDISALGLLPARDYPRATSSIEEMQEMIARLLARDHAYEIDGEVFFRIASRPGFGELSRLNRAEMLAAEAEQDAPTLDDPRKEDPLDFPLWKGSAPGEPSWESPWGPGRPGWHIECSTLAIKHLGVQIDIHGGGSDLIYPHHECEIAQSEAVTSVRPFARFWVHVEMARLDGRKMSKSDGNMVFVRDLLRENTADAVKLYLLQTHYRRPLDFDPQGVVAAEVVAASVAQAAVAPIAADAHDPDPADSIKRFEAALEDDLATPEAVRALADLADAVLEAAARGGVSRSGQRAVRSLAARLGLQLLRRRGPTLNDRSNLG